jgi:hypothetical protein
MIRGTHNTGDIFFDSNSVREIMFIDYHERGNTRFRNLKSDMDSESLFGIENSDMGGMKFLSSDFSSYKKMVINNSSISSIDCVNVKWPETILTSGEFKKIDYLEQRDVYRQLKLAMNKIHNKFDEINFKSKELHSHLKTLSLRNPTQWLDIIILKLNYLSSNHGLNWLIPLLWIIVIAAGFHTLLLYLHDYSETIHFWKFVLFINPAHKVNYMGDSLPIINTVSMWVDFLGRILIGYFTFHFIRATRKFVLK